MIVKPKNRWILRFAILALMLLSIGLGVALIAYVFSQNITYFYTPSEIPQNISGTQQFRLGGLIKQDSIKRQDEKVYFIVIDDTAEISAEYKGITPNLFKEGVGVIATGSLKDGRFIATEILAKHDENYMPKEVADKIKSTGQWRN